MSTIKDIARHSGVSYQTVSYVLNNSRPVSEKTQQRVLDSIKALSYHPNAVARGLLKKRLNTLGIVFPYSPASLIAHHHLGPLFDGVLQVAQRNHQSVTVLSAEAFPESVARLSLYCDGRSDGLLIVGQPTDSEFVTALAAGRTPFVCVNESWDDTAAGIPCVDVDQVGAAVRVTELLLGRGHRRVAALMGPGDAVNVVQRLRGFRLAMERARVPVIESLLLEGEYSEKSGYERALQIVREMSPTMRPTALLCFNDQIALGALSALTASSVRVPAEMSVTGFDDMPAAAVSHPPLTTTRLPMRPLGERAAEMLLAQIEGTRRREEQGRQLLPTQLVERGSVAAAWSPPVAGHGGEREPAR